MKEELYRIMNSENDVYHSVPSQWHKTFSAVNFIKSSKQISCSNTLITR